MSMLEFEEMANLRQGIGTALEDHQQNTNGSCSLFQNQIRGQLGPSKNLTKTNNQFDITYMCIHRI